MENIPIKYTLPQVKFEVPPLDSQVLSIHLRKKPQEGTNSDAAEYQWSLISDTFEVSNEGIPVSPITLSGLDDDTLYEMKLTNNSTGQECVKDFHTCVPLGMGDSPIYMKKFFRGQVLQWYIGGLTSEAFPANDGGFYYDLTGKFADMYDGYGPMDSPLGKNWTLKTDDYAGRGDILESLNCFYINPDNTGIGKYLTFNMTHENTDARLPLGDIFGGSGYTMVMKVYLDESFSNAKILSSTAFELRVNDDRTVSVYRGSTQAAVSTAKVEAKRWYTIMIKGGTTGGTTNINAIEIYQEVAGVTTILMTLTGPFSLGQYSSLTNTSLHLGAREGTTTGLSVCKIYLSVNTLTTSSENFRRIAQCYKYICSLKFSQTGTGGGGIAFAAGTGFKVGNSMQSGYGMNADKKPLEIKVTYNYSGADTLHLRCNSYLWQYVESVGVVPATTASSEQALEQGTNREVTFTFPNEFAYHARMDMELVLTTGTTLEDSTLEILSIANGADALSIASIFTASTDRTAVVLSDGVNGSLISHVSATLPSSTLRITLQSLSATEASTTVFINDNARILKIDGSGLMACIDPAIEPGIYNMYCQSEMNPEKIGNIEVEIVETKDNIDRDGFDINFSDNFDEALTTFKRLFHANHTQWGGYNGGCNGNLIYGDRAAGCLHFEQHGDDYTGTVVGVAKPAKDSSFTGYGIQATRTAPNDPKEGEPFRTRVGSIAVSDKYYGHGEVNIWLRTPKGIYGVCPAIWLFHYIEVYPSQEEWDYWLGRGGKPYWGGDTYMVINNEIDMELPSHDTNGTFADWYELGNAYFDPKALDTMYRVGVYDEDGTDPAKRGTFQLVDVTKPTLFASWKKISDEIQERNYPTFDACKFNNWVGEKSSGNGWGYQQADYGDEEYLALLTKLSRDYADGEFHKWTLKWYGDRTELWIDNVHIRDNRAFVPFNVMRLTFGGWFPSQKEEKYTPEAPGSWAGLTAPWEFLHLDISRLSFIPFVEAEQDSAETHAETYPEAGLREFV